MPSHDGRRRRVQSTETVRTWCRDCEAGRDHVLRTTWYPRRGTDLLRRGFDPGVRHKVTCRVCGRGTYVEVDVAVRLRGGPPDDGGGSPV